MHSEQRVVRTFVVRGLTVLMKPPPWPNCFSLEQMRTGIHSLPTPSCSLNFSRNFPLPTVAAHQASSTPFPVGCTGRQTWESLPKYYRCPLALLLSLPPEPGITQLPKVFHSALFPLLSMVIALFPFALPLISMHINKNNKRGVKENMHFLSCLRIDDCLYVCVLLTRQLITPLAYLQSNKNYHSGTKSLLMAYWSRSLLQCISIVLYHKEKSVFRYNIRQCHIYRLAGDIAHLGNRRSEENYQVRDAKWSMGSWFLFHDQKPSRGSHSLMRFLFIYHPTDLLVYTADKVKPFLKHFLPGKKTRCLNDAVQRLFPCGLKDTGSVIHTCVVFGTC